MHATPPVHRHAQAEGCAQSEWRTVGRGLAAPKARTAAAPKARTAAASTVGAPKARTVGAGARDV